MATRAMAAGVACLFCRLRAKASVGQGSTAARGALRPRGARRGHPGLHRSSPRGAPAAQHGDHGGAGFAWGKGWEEGGGRGEAHHALESGGGGPEVGDQRPGAELDGSINGGL